MFVFLIPAFEFFFWFSGLSLCFFGLVMSILAVIKEHRKIMAIVAGILNLLLFSFILIAPAMIMTLG